MTSSAAGSRYTHSSARVSNEPAMVSTLPVSLRYGRDESTRQVGSSQQHGTTRDSLRRGTGERGRPDSGRVQVQVSRSVYGECMEKSLAILLGSLSCIYQLPQKRVAIGARTHAAQTQICRGGRVCGPDSWRGCRLLRLHKSNETSVLRAC